MKVKVNLSNQTLEYMDSQPYIQGTDTRNKLSVYIKHSTVPQTEGAFNIMIAYALQNGRTTIKMANTGATQETIDETLYDVYYFTAPKVLTSISGNFVATLILKVNSNTYKVNVLNTVLNAVDFEAFEDALDDTASEVLESLESMAEDITYLQSQVVGVLHNTDIVDNDDSNDPTKVLSARMGKVLAERIGATTSGLVSATYNESTGVLTLTYENDDTYEMKIGLSTTDKSNMADDVENTILADLFETFSTVKSYSVGDFVNYENNIYEFVSNKSSGAWDNTKVVVANLNDYMEEVNTSLTNMTETIEGLGQLQPSGIDTSTNILAFNEDKGIYIATDNGHWYYWNGTQYVDGGVYEATNGIGFKNTTSSIDFNALDTNTIYNILGANATHSPDGYSSSRNYTLIDITTSTSAGSLRRQMLFGNDNVIYQRLYYGSSWQSWYNNKLTNITNIGGTSSTIDFNTLETNTIYNILGASNYSNAPTGFSSSHNYTLLDITTSTGVYSSFRKQIMYSSANVIYQRFYASGSWGAWISNTASTLTLGNTTTSIDFNNVATNNIYNILTGSTSNISNGPVGVLGTHHYTLIDVTTNTGVYSNFRRQLLFDSSAVYYQRFYASGSWGDWVTCGTKVYNPTTAQQLIDMCEEAVLTPNSIVNLTGTYDLSNLLTKDIKLGNGIKLIGSGNSKIIFNYTGSDTDVMDNISPFKKGVAGGFTLENITMECSNCRYCVHDENNANADVYHNKYINCDFYIDNSASQSTINVFACIGGGLGANGTIEINNCKFHSIPKPSYTGSIMDASYHNSSSSSAQSKLFISNTYFEHTFRLTWYGTSTAITKCYVNNCSIASALIHQAETSGSTTENTELIAWNNEIRS